MSTVVTFNGLSYIVPATGEVGWGNNVSSYLIAIAAGALQKTGGSFVLSAETDFGSSFGLKSLYYKSESADIATSGIIRLNNNSDSVSFRNNANSANLPLAVNTSDQLTFNGAPIGGSGLFTANRAIVSDSSGNLTAASTTSTEIGYVSGVTSSIQTQLDSKEPSFTILSISKGGTNSGTALNNNRVIQSSGGAIIEAAAITAARALISDANGIPTHSTTTATELGYVSGVTSAIQTQLNSKLNLSGGTLTGDLTFASNKGIFWTDNSTNTVKITAPTSVTTYTMKWPIAQGSSNQYLTNDGSGNLSWTNAAGTGTVNTGTQYQLTYYATTANTVSGDSSITTNAANQLLVIMGAAGTPSYSFSGDPDTGIFNGTANRIDFAVGGTNIAQLNSSGFTTEAQSSAAFLAQSSVAGDILGVFVDNQSNTASSDARLALRVAGTSAGNPFINFSISGNTQWCVGIDNADSDKFKISQATSLGSNNYLNIDPSTGNTSVQATTGVDTTLFITPSNTNNTYVQCSNGSGSLKIGCTTGTFNEDSVIQASANLRCSFGSGLNNVVTFNNGSTDLLTISGDTTDIYSTAWTDYSGTSTITGWSSFTTKKLFYKKIGKIVYVSYELIGTSNSTSTSFTLADSSNSNVELNTTNYNRDNGGSFQFGLTFLGTSTSTTNLYPTAAAGNWTASGTKDVRGNFWYQTA